MMQRPCAIIAWRIPCEDRMTAAGKSGEVSVLRGTVVTCHDDPFLTDPTKAFAVESDGLVICRDGLVEAVGPAAELRARVPPGAAVTDYSGCLIAPGFIDTHVH